MRLAFMGSAEFGIPVLEALLAAGHEVVALYTQPARPSGRGRSASLAPVGRFAAQHGLPIRTPARLKRNPEEWEAFRALRLDAAVVAAYGLILPEEMLAIPTRGILNVHASLLPRWRGAAPVQAAILAGDEQTGVTIMQVDAGLDSGPILLSEALPIPSDATGESLTRALARLGARLIVEALASAPAARAQPEEGVTYAPRLTRSDGRIDWRGDAALLARKVRAFHPRPGSSCAVDPTSDSTFLKILEARAHEHRSVELPGTILDASFLVACGEGALELVSVQPPSGRPMPGAAFLRGRGKAYRLGVGARLG